MFYYSLWRQWLWNCQCCNATNLFVSRQKEKHISIPELVKKLTVPPARRTDVDCKLMADALYAFVSSIEAWKDGLLISSNHTNTALSRISNFRLPYAQVLSKRLHSQWPDMLSCRLWTRTKQCFCKVLDPMFFSLSSYARSLSWFYLVLEQ